jgi:hypothetical protein
MSSQTSQTSVLVCRAPHPRAGRGDGRFEGRLCGKRLQVVPFRVRPTYRAIHDWSEVHAGCIAVRCLARDCRAFTEYEIVRDQTDRAAERDTDRLETTTRTTAKPAATYAARAGRRRKE